MSGFTPAAIPNSGRCTPYCSWFSRLNPTEVSASLLDYHKPFLVRSYHYGFVGLDSIYTASRMACKPKETREQMIVNKCIFDAKLGWKQMNK